MCLLLFIYYIIEEDQPKISYFVYDVSKGAFSYNEFNDKCVDVFNTLNGQIIYPSPILFVDLKDQYLVVLITFSTINIDLSIYNPSLIVETCRYILYNKFDIYHQNEINVICKLIKNFVNQSVKS